MVGLMVTKYECFTCDQWIKKSERDEHKKQDHDIAEKGKNFKPELPEVRQPEPTKPIGEVRTGRFKAPKDAIKEIDRKEKTIEQLAREMYPNTYMLLDTLRGSLLGLQR